MKRFIRGLGILLALFLLAGLFTAAAAEESGAVPDALNAIPKTLWDEGELLEDGSILYTVSIIDGDTVVETYTIKISPDGTVEVKNSAGEVISTGKAEMDEDGNILSMELTLEDGTQLNQIRQIGEHGQAVILSQVILPDGSSSIIARSFDAATGEMLSSVYTEYGIDGQPLFEIEETATGKENGQTVYTTNVATYSYEEPADETAVQATGGAGNTASDGGDTDAAPAQGGTKNTPAQNSVNAKTTPAQGSTTGNTTTTQGTAGTKAISAQSTTAAKATPVKSIVATGGNIQAASSSGAVTKTTVTYTSASTSYKDWNSAVNQNPSGKITTTTTNVIDTENKTMVIVQERQDSDGSKVVIEDFVTGFTEEHYGDSTPQTRKVTKYDANGNKLSESNYNWVKNEEEDRFDLQQKAGEEANNDEYGRNHIVNDAGERVGTDLGEVYEYHEIETDEEGNPKLTDGKLNDARLLDDGTNQLGGLDPAPGKEISQENIPPQNTGSNGNDGASNTGLGATRGVENSESNLGGSEGGDANVGSGGDEGKNVSDDGNEDKNVGGGDEGKNVSGDGNEDINVGGEEEDKNVSNDGEEDKNVTDGGVEDKNVSNDGEEDKNVTDGGVEDKNVTDGGVEDKNVTDGGEDEDNNNSSSGEGLGNNGTDGQ